MMAQINSTGQLLWRCSCSFKTCDLSAVVTGQDVKLLSVTPPSDLELISDYPNLHHMHWWNANGPPCLLFLHNQNIDPSFLPQLLFSLTGL